MTKDDLSHYATAIERGSHLDDEERRELAAYLRSLAVEPPSTEHFSKALDHPIADEITSVEPPAECEHEWMEVVGKRGVYKPSWFCPKCWTGQRERPTSLNRPAERE